MNEVTTINASQKMTSLEIAEYAGKEHRNVTRDIQKLIDEKAISPLNFEQSTYTNERGKEYPMFILDFDATMILVTGYDAKKRAAVIKRWRQLETGAAMPALAGNTHHTMVKTASYLHLLQHYHATRGKKAAIKVNSDDSAAMKQDILAGLTTAQVAKKYDRAKSTVKKHTKVERARIVLEKSGQMMLFPEEN